MTIKITLDPGHGKTGNPYPPQKGYYEGTQMWKLANFLKAELKKYGFQVVTTRPNLNDDPSLSDRGQTAGKNGSSLFISLHSNAPASASDTKPTGSVVYYSMTDSKNKVFADLVGKKVSEIMGHYYRGSLTRQYPDKPGVDYYGVIRASAQSGCKAAFIIEHGFHTNLQDSAFLIVDSNLQRLAVEEAKVIANYFGKTADKQTPVKEDEKKPYTGNTNEQTVFNYCKQVMGLNEAASCGVLANINAESSFRPNNLQNTFEKSLGYTDDGYTKAVDSGTYTNFVNDSAGYGLVQWTYWSRKQNLLNYAKKVGASIGSMNMQLDFFAQEIKAYTKVWDCLKSVPNTAEGAYTAAHTMCYYYEAPGSKETASVTRGNAAKDFFKKYGTVTPSTPDKTLYRVQTGAFSVKANADALLAKVKAAGFDTYMVQVNGLYKVQVGAYSVKANADAMAAKLKAKGFDTYITTQSGTAVSNTPTPKPEPKVIKVGSKVKIKANANVYGKTTKFQSWVYPLTWIVHSMSSDRVVVNKDTTGKYAIMSPVKLTDLTLVD